MGIKITMPPDAVNSAAGALIARQVLREIVSKSVMTPFDEHYFAVMMHKGVSGDLQHTSFNDLAKLLSRPTPMVHHYIAEHMVSGSARGGCKFCNKASQELKKLIVEEKTRVTAPKSLSPCGSPWPRSRPRDADQGSDSGEDFVSHKTARGLIGAARHAPDR
jgi:hypothetical protein